MKALSSARFAGLRLLVVCCALGSSCFAQFAVKVSRSVPPKGTFNRPSDGVRHPQLDDAWMQYRTAVATAVADFTSALDKKVEVETAKGDPNAVRLSRAWRTMFEEQGILPAGDRSMQRHVQGAGMALRLANEKLLDAYDKVIQTLTREEKEAEARAVGDERVSLESGLAFPPISNVPWPLFDGKDWFGWGIGWGQGRHDVIADDKAIRLTGFKFFSHARVLTSDVTFELDFRIRPRDRQDPLEPSNCAVQVGVQTDAGGCLVRIPARDAAGHIVPGKAEVIHFDNLVKQTHVLIQFDCPPAVAGKWRTCRFSRRGDSYSVAIDGKDVVNDQPLPDQVRQNFNLHIGVGDGIVDFRNLRLTEDVPLAAPKP